MMLLLASMTVVAGHNKSTSATPPSTIAVVPPRMTATQLAFVPPLAGHRRFYRTANDAMIASRRARCLAPAPAARASALAVEAKRSPDSDAAALAADAADKQSFAEQKGGDGADGGGGGAGGGRSGRGKRRKRKMKSLQERLNDMRLDFSLDDREPYVAGAPARITAPPESPSSNSSASSSGPAVGRQAMYHNYRRRRRPLNALCMPKNQRPQGCAPLLPPIGSQPQQPAAVDHVTLELNRVGEDLSEFKSDLPCVTSGTCPVPYFRCSKGHVWESNGSPVCFYCPVCADTRIKTRPLRKRDLEVMQEIARGRGGECIADEYLGIFEKIAFRCGDGHEWLASPANIVYKNTWCPKCAALRSVERKKLTLADMHQTARQFGGVFLSPEYHGAAVKHEWRCKRGHTFWNAPNNIRRAEGGRRVATFCKICNTMDRNILKAALVGGLSKDEAKSTLEELTKVGAMPRRRYFLKRRATGKSTLASKRREMKRITSIKRSNSSGINSIGDYTSLGKTTTRSSGSSGGGSIPPR